LREGLGKSEPESYFTEIAPLLNEIGLARKKLEKWQKPCRVSTSLINHPGASFIERWPFGVALIAAPWNYPLYLSCVPLVSALAGGNCVVLKPSEKAPRSSEVICDMVKRAFNRDTVCAVEGGPDVLTGIIRSRPDLIFFTGGNKAGCSVMREASNGPVPVILELGGKNPCIVENGADLRTAARRIVWGKFINAGQSCVAPDFVFAQREIGDKLIGYCAEAVKKFYGADPRLSLDYGRMVNQFHFSRVSRLIRDGEIVCGGDTDKKQLYIAPTLVRNPGWESGMMKEEIFGPLLPFHFFENREECISRLASMPRPLALYIFTCDRNGAGKYWERLRSGVVCVNGTVHSVIGTGLPFGGIGESGMGRYHGESGFKAFTYERSILRKTCWFVWPFIYPPYRFFGALKGIVRRMIRP
ncbi:MAG: aldehyde dehydrogenase family protein, partial [Fibrobacterota bacterium]